MQKTVAIIGSTGSIGTQALEVCLARGHRVCALAAGKNAELLLRQALLHRPRRVALEDAAGAAFLRRELAGSGIEVLEGESGVCAAAAADESDIVLNAAVGIAGLKPTLAALEAGKPLALANKESLVCAGSLVMEAAKQAGVPILPVDSEHSAIFQCLLGGKREEAERIILTASGGPFFGRSAAELEAVTVADALKHPSWTMGRKITIDSATMMNKGFEVIEAHFLFGFPLDAIDVLVHPQSIVHSLVEFRDGATLAQLSHPHMGLAIQYALDFPDRYTTNRDRLDLVKANTLTFYPPDEAAFPALNLCRQALMMGGTAGAVLNGANEAAVARFLSGEIPFPGITALAASALSAVPNIENPTLDDILQADHAARIHVRAVTDRGVSPPASAGGEHPNKLFGKKLEQKLTRFLELLLFRNCM